MIGLLLAATVALAAKGAPPSILDARISPNLALGADPPALPSTQRQQAEPHVYRCASNPDLLLAAVQEGRFADGNGGSLSCGYAVSTDGGFSWQRNLLPQLTQRVGGPYFRATDPVAAIDLQGTLYEASLEARDAGFTLGDLVVSRSTDRGVTWTNHVAFSTPNTLLFPDKDWLAVNDFAGAPHAGRLVATYTGFTQTAAGTATGDSLFAVTSDNGGDTWTAPVAVTPARGSVQGSQPFFLPDGSLLCVYADYFSDTGFVLRAKRSTDGGASWPSAAAAVSPSQVEYADPIMRTGGALPAVAVARNTGAAFVTWQALGTDGTVRINVARSLDQGTTWSAALPVSDNSAADAPFNPAIAVTPDGQAVTVVFYDRRLGPDSLNFADLFAAFSFDGGLTWSSNVRVSDFTSDLRLSQSTVRGYMVGDYLGLAPPLTAQQGCFAVWCDTRNGQSDLFGARIAPRPTPDYASWTAVRFTAADQAAGRAAETADPDGDQTANVVEYALGTDPLRPEYGAALQASALPGNAGYDVSWRMRTGAEIGLALHVITTGGATLDLPVTAPAYDPANPTTTAHQTVPAPAGAGRITLTLARPGGAGPAFADAVPLQGDARLINLSARGAVTASAPLVAGFFTSANARPVLLRGVGPSLAAFGIPAPLPDPFLTLQAAGGGAALATNDNWGDGGGGARLSQAAAQVGAFPLTAASGADSAVLASLGAGGYVSTVTAGGGAAAGTGGIALAEIYDVTPAADAGRLLNLSARSQTAAGAAQLTGGFVISGTSPKRVLLRAVGPALASFNVPQPLTDPLMTVYRVDGTVLAANDDWFLARDPAVTAAVSARTGAFALPAASADASLVLTLDPGLYTVSVSATDLGTGTALIEIYDAD